MGNYFNIPDDSKCILCDTNIEGDAILIPDIETQDGYICEARICHIDCLQRELFIQNNFIIARIPNKNKE